MSASFQTTRLRLRQWQDSDRQPFAEMNQDPDVMRYFPRHFTPEESNAFIDSNIRQIESDRWGAWAVELIEQKRFIGFVGFSQPARWHPCAGNIDVGWRIGSNYWNQGNATEAARHVVTRGFASLGFDCLVAYTSECNLASINVMRKIGMHRDGVGFEHPRIGATSRLRKHVVYRLSRVEWENRDDLAREINNK